MKSVFFRIFAAALPLFMLLQLAARPVITITTDKPDAIYQAGETAVFTVSAKEKGKPAAGLEVMFVFRGEKIYSKPQKLTLNANGEVKVSRPFDRPGQLQCSVYLPGDKFVPGDFTGKGVIYYGAMFSPEKLQPMRPAPADFNEFWDKEKAAMQQLPLNTEIKPVKAEKGFKAYSVKINAPEGDFAWGFLTMPADAKPGTLPICLKVHGAGTYSVKPLFRQNLAVFSLNPHNLPNGKPWKFYVESRKKLEKIDHGRYYMYLNNTDHTKSYFLGMYRRDYRAMQFLTSLPEWNGKDFFVTGASQGGAQTLVCAGLEPRITKIYARVAACCDWCGFLDGREPGWPYRRPRTRRGNLEKFMAETAYFDAVNFARNIKTPKCILTTGFSDAICKATSVYCAFNVIPAPDKKMITDPAARHNSKWPEEALCSDL